MDSGRRKAQLTRPDRRASTDLMFMQWKPHGPRTVPHQALHHGKTRLTPIVPHRSHVRSGQDLSLLGEIAGTSPTSERYCMFPDNVDNVLCRFENMRKLFRALNFRQCLIVTSLILRSVSDTSSTPDSQTIGIAGSRKS